jgi:hypothetical protein
MSHSVSKPIPCARPKQGGRGLLVIAVLFAVLGAGGMTLVLTAKGRPVNAFAGLRNIDQGVADEGLARIEREWRPESAVMTLEMIPFAMHYGHREKLYDLLRRHTGQTFADADRTGWYRWLWTQPPPDAAVLNRWRHEFYSLNNGYPLGSLGGYFAGNTTMLIRADEVVWSGALRDTITPIRKPVMVPAGDADFLKDAHVVYGVCINGDARAYPRRILGHHEMVIDTVGGEPITGVYCILCETMIAYHSRTADGRLHNFGNSGFLYRSNKLMYDTDTLSLWSTITGEPVVGKLAASGVRLELSPVVTTTWGEWKRAHPSTHVLSLRDLPNEVPQDGRDGPPIDYSEGAAYRQYNTTDELIFPTPFDDTRLKNKDQVFVPRLAGNHKPVAMSIAFLKAHPVHRLQVGDTNLLVVTSASGANRAYAVGNRLFADKLTSGKVTDDAGQIWTVTEDSLIADGQPPLPRAHGHRAFWFAWHAAHPDTELIK